MRQTEKLLKIETIFKLLKITAWISLAGYCIKKVFDIKHTYDQGRITSTQYSEIETPFLYPSLTVCVNMDKEISGPDQNMTWWSHEKYLNYTQLPFELITKMDEPFCRDKKKNVDDIDCNLSSFQTLNKYGFKFEDFWDAQLRGIMGESSPCYSFSCNGKREIGFPNKIRFRLNTRRDPQIMIVLSVHDKGRYNYNMANLFGNYHVFKFVDVNTNITANTYEVQRQRITELNRPKHRCIEDQSIVPIGMARFTDTNSVTTIEECLNGYIELKMGCLLPWLHLDVKCYDGQECTLCSTPDQFKKYRDLIWGVSVMETDEALEAWKCVPSCTYNKYIVREIFESNFDVDVYNGEKNDGSNFQQQFIFLRPEVEIIEKIWLMDGDGFFANAGGFLGLLLGTSCLQLVELILACCFKLFLRHKKQ